jgi:pimeloyl-ACP methyl ester carboxylesterase
MAPITPQTGTITSREAEQVERANASGKTPVVFIHGLWLLPSSWDRWAELFEQAAARSSATMAANASASIARVSSVGTRRTCALEKPAR